MTKKQKKSLFKLSSVIIITLAAILAIINLKDFVNRLETTRAMTSLSQIILKYRKDQGSVPPQSYIDEIKNNLPGIGRLGNFKYRGRWIDPENPKEEILAYAEKDFRTPFVESGVIVLRLDGTVEWMKKRNFEVILTKQQTPFEIQHQEVPF